MPPARFLRCVPALAFARNVLNATFPFLVRSVKYVHVVGQHCSPTAASQMQPVYRTYHGMTRRPDSYPCGSVADWPLVGKR